MKKKSEIPHISVCGNWVRLHGRYRETEYLFTWGGTIKNCLKYLNRLTGYQTRWWDNGAKHPARDLEFITVEEYLLLI